mgnify:CR=1 FL=1
MQLVSGCKINKMRPKQEDDRCLTGRLRWDRVEHGSAASDLTFEAERVTCPSILFWKAADVRYGLSSSSNFFIGFQRFQRGR